MPSKNLHSSISSSSKSHSQDTIHDTKELVGGKPTQLKKYESKMGIFPFFRGEHSKNIGKTHHLEKILRFLGVFSFRQKIGTSLGRYLCADSLKIPCKAAEYFSNTWANRCLDKKISNSPNRWYENHWMRRLVEKKTSLKTSLD